MVGFIIASVRPNTTSINHRLKVSGARAYLLTFEDRVRYGFCRQQQYLLIYTSNVRVVMIRTRAALRRLLTTFCIITSLSQVWPRIDAVFLMTCTVLVRISLGGDET